MSDRLRPAPRQSTDTVLMVRPAAFYPNAETAGDNHFQQILEGLTPHDLLREARLEFDRLAAALSDAGVTVHVVEARAMDDTPDALFPNNWFSTHDDGRVVLYPMSTPNRRRERRADIIERLSREYCLFHDATLDLSHLENQRVFLEGTGSLLLDRLSGVAYVCRSTRSCPEAIRAFATAMNYQVVTFESFDSNDAPVYHTNVMLALGTAFAVVCLESVPAGADRVALEQSLRQSGRELILITRAQMGEFCGNILELATPTGDRVLAMSTRAKAALTADQQQALGRHARIVAVPIPTIERVGGGGVRCMLAELFLPAA